MFKILALSVMIVFIGCAQNAKQQVSETSPLEYQLIAHTGMDSLPATDVTRSGVPATLCQIVKVPL